MTERNSIIVAGNEAQLKTLIMDLLHDYGKSGSGTFGATGYRSPIQPDFRDWLQLTLHWRGITEATLKNHTVEKSVRLRGIDPKTVSLNYLQELGRKVLAKFNNLDYKTGHIKVKYADYDNGFRTWGYFNSRQDGYRIIEAMGDILGKGLDLEQLKYEESANPQKAYDQNGKLINIANKRVRTRAKAPIANMRFYGATILFPYIGHTEQLCNISGYILRSLSFLDAYND